MARVLKGSHSFTCTPRVHPLTEWTIPAFVFPAEAGTHLPTQKGWKAELSTGWLQTEIDVRHWELNPDTVAHLSTNRAWRRLTSLIEADASSTTPDHRSFVFSPREITFDYLRWYCNAPISSFSNGRITNFTMTTMMMT